MMAIDDLVFINSCSWTALADPDDLARQLNYLVEHPDWLPSFIQGLAALVECEGTTLQVDVERGAVEAVTSALVHLATR